MKCTEQGLLETKGILDAYDSDDQISEGDHEIDDTRRSYRVVTRKDAEKKAKPKLVVA